VTGLGHKMVLRRPATNPKKLVHILEMHRLADHDHAFIGKDAGIAHGDLPLLIPVNPADENFSVETTGRF
jgi:hypothetical protein